MFNLPIAAGGRFDDLSRDREADMKFGKAYAFATTAYCSCISDLRIMLGKRIDVNAAHPESSDLVT